MGEARAELSVVVAAFSGVPRLARCLEALHGQASSAEVVVATSLDGGAIDPLRQSFPGVSFVSAPPGVSVFRLRTLGIGATSGRWVALLEDHAVPSPGWMGAVLMAHRAGCDALGGAVEHGLRGSLSHWALYFCEYGSLMPPIPEGWPGVRLAVNASYRREKLDACREVWKDVFVDNEVHDALAACGSPLRLVGDAVVTSHLGFTFPAAVRHLFRGGRRYAGYRGRFGPRWLRLLHVAASPVLPLVLVLRLLRNVLSRRPGRLAVFLPALPWLLLLVSAWSAGEAVGWITPRSRLGVR